MFDSLFSLFSHDLAIDLGTANTLVYVRGKGIAVREPSIVARHNKSKKIIAVGGEAKKMLGKTPGTISTIKPLDHGVISDFDAATSMFSHFIRKVHEVGTPFYQLVRPRIAVGIPSGVTEVERRAVWEAALQAGARECYVVEEPMAAAVGAGVSVFEPTGVCIVDIGGGTSEIAVISLGGIVINRSLKLAGNEMDQAVASYVRLRHGLLIGERTAEEVKIRIGSAYKGRGKVKGEKGKLDSKEEKILEGQDMKSPSREAWADRGDVEVEEGSASAKASARQGEKMAIIRGRDIETGLPKSLRITEVEVREAIGSVIGQIIDNLMEVIEETPPELTGDILEHGIMLSGGGALLPGLPELIVERTKIPAILVDDPLTTVVRGVAKILEDRSLLNQVKVTGGLR